MPAASTDAVFVGVDTHADTHHRSCRRPTRRPPRRPRVPRGSDRLPQPPGLDLLNRISHRRGSGRHRNLRSPLGRVLTAAGLAVLEVNRPDRATRRINGKSDPVDAYAAAQAVVSGRADSVPKSRDGIVESIRCLRVARRSAIKAKTQCINQIRGLLITGPLDLREQMNRWEPSA